MCRHVMATVLQLVLCENAQHCGALAMILLYHKTLKMISMMLFQYPVSCASEVLSPVLLGNPYISPFNSFLFNYDASHISLMHW